MITASNRAGPFTHAANSISRTMGWVLAALVPATSYGLWLFGWPALWLWGVTLLSALATEAAMLALLGQPVRARLFDGSALLTGWLLALSLPPWAPWWIGAMGSFVAIAMGKHLFGGLGQNPFNPAMVARVVLLISFPVQMTLWVAPAPLGSPNAPDLRQSLQITAGLMAVPDHMSAASALGRLQTERSRGVPANKTSATLPPPAQMAAGHEPGSLGETSALLLLAGGLLLLALRIIAWHTPVALLGTMGVLAWFSNALDPAHFASASVHLLSGAAMLGAFFIATDYVTTPVSRAGQLVFGAGIGALTWVIRSLGGYPEGLAFAVLIMNALVPLIDRGLRPRVFGRNWRGQPIAPRGSR
ncbi:MAG: RnfABCDGE type electron transport complex subunit D [Rubrivivax sp.]|jgi:electron transport complex protein RnfD|nr:RnfABCDGE type electron transport complex subunit D [Rubrivivax sp.]